MKNGNIIFATLFAIGWLEISQIAQPVSPPPDGGYPGGNTAEGHLALGSLTTGVYNSAVGVYSLLSLTTGSFNTANGAGTLLVNTADENTANGAGALLSNSTGAGNTANGVFALFSNTEGEGNTAIGSNALVSNTTGDHNTASGFTALGSNTTGNGNTAIGIDALFSNTEGEGNTAVGFQALVSNMTGAGNTAIGFDALLSSTGSNNTALGVGAGDFVTTANNVIAIGSPGVNVSNSCFVGHIYNVITHSVTSVPVIVTDEGQLGTIPSSKRFKKDIDTMDEASEAILTLKPVTFHYKSDATKTPQFGLIAEEVAEVNPALVVRDKEGRPHTVRYDAINAMLLNEFLKEHRKVEEQQIAIEQLKKELGTVSAQHREEIRVLRAQLDEQATRIQQISTQVEKNKEAPRIVSK
jgi:Chaperone of endosialidase